MFAIVVGIRDAKFFSFLFFFAFSVALDFLNNSLKKSVPFSFHGYKLLIYWNLINVVLRYERKGAFYNLVIKC